ncbi:MAG: DUF3237 domain-containing protein [Mesorhizobium sp.]|nr:MAG: DUF3237 domain-containing protein [Mesorhizobium sp.]RWB57989.1 MAG: DUF3237 domain-containing protein [Mesorhizobium sp.]RWB82213.1 MAG: DUF3237 domain-containing protein [Mesorhizobium sp.]RWD75889.1 MAG: DUF3237 domain-containing protein [Mesorhizobium sp.]TIU75367.1 MAG: DUF3237 domain-containing protein [Mesorhizobium sp.]
MGGFAVLHTRPLFSIRLAVDALLAVGGPEGNGRRIGSISGGTFKGDRLSGTVLPGGTDWQLLRGDGAVQLDARIVLKTDDDALIAMTYVGLRHGPPDVLERLNRGEPVDPGNYYFRIVPSFATSDHRYDWLNRIVAVGIGQRLPTGPDYSVHEIL